MDTYNTKYWWASKAVIGGAVSAVAGLAGLFGYSVSPEDAGEVTAAVLSVVSLIGGLLSIIGRVKASKKIK